MASVSLQGGEVDVSEGMQQQVHACPVPLLSLPESFNGSPDRVQDGSCCNAGGTSTGQGDQLYGADTTAREPAPSEASLPQPQPHSPTIKRGAISTRFRAERAIVAMAQRAVSWRGPELWLVTGASRLEVKLGPPLRDLPSASDHALATVFRTVGALTNGPESTGACTQLLLIRDGCVIGPWAPSELRHSRDHAVCITPDVLPRGEVLPTQCSGELMGLLAGYAQRRLKDEDGGPQGGSIPAAERDECRYAWEEDSAMDYVNEAPETMHRAAVTPDSDMLERPTLLERQANDHGSFADEQLQSEQDDQEEEEEEDDDDDETFPAEYDDFPAEIDAGEDAPGPQRSPCAQTVVASNADLEPTGSAAPSSRQSEPSVVMADQFVREAQNAWMQAKDPNRSTQNRAVLRGSLQQIFTRQEGTDLRNLCPTSVFDDENAIADARPVDDPSQHQSEDSAMKQPARGRWAAQAPVVLAPLHQEEESRSTAKHKRGGRLKGAEDGGPAGIVASAGHLQHLERLRARTTAARTMWQTTNALEALRLVASHNDAALSTSILSCVAGQSAIAGAAETALAMTLARPLLVAGNAPLVMKPVAALLNAARRHAQQHSEASEAEAAGLSGERARLLHETMEVCARLDELRVDRDGAGGSSFDAQFAFGQALALARQAGRDAWRALDSQSFATQAAAPPGRDGSQPALGGRRAW